MENQSAAEMVKVLKERTQALRRKIENAINEEFPEVEEFDTWVEHFHNDSPEEVVIQMKRLHPETFDGKHPIFIKQDGLMMIVSNTTF